MKYGFLTISGLALAVFLAGCSGGSSIKRAPTGLSIEGTVYRGDSRQPYALTGDSGVAGRTVYLFGEIDDSTLTDEHGRYRFSDIPQGYYLVSQGFSPGWFRSYPIAGISAMPRNLADDAETHRVFARVASDLYRWRIVQGTDAGYRLPDDVTRLDKSWSSFVSKDVVTIERRGEYFSAKVCEDGSLRDENDRANNVQDGHLVGVSPLAPVTSGVDFVTFPKRVSGKILLTLQDGEAGVPGARIRLVGPTSRETWSDSTGAFSFEDFAWDVYSIIVEPPPGYVLIAPSASLLPAERLYERRRELQTTLERIHRDANAHYTRHQGYAWTGYLEYRLPPELREDALARYSATPMGRDTILIAARTHDERDSLIGIFDRPGILSRLTMSPDLEDRTRSEPGAYLDLLDMRWAGDHVWLDYRVAPLVHLAGRVSEHARTVRAAGSIDRSIDVESDGTFRSDPLPPGPYVVFAIAGDGTKDHRGAVSEHLALCMRRLTQIVADAYRFRIAPMPWGGGGGTFRGYRPPLELREGDDIRADVNVAPADLDVTVISPDGSGTVSACLDWHGIVSAVKVTGRFLELRPQVVYTDEALTREVEVVLPGDPGRE